MMLIAFSSRTICISFSEIEGGFDFVLPVRPVDFFIYSIKSMVDS
jgi:hypothetical protein